MADMQAEEAELAKLTDEQVLAMADLQMSQAENHRLSRLLDKNREGALTAKDRRDLDALMKIYTDGTLEKAKGWAEAVRRGLRAPLSS